MKTSIITGADVSALLDKMVLLQDENKRLAEQVGATVAATAGRCAEIAEEEACRRCRPPVVGAIRREFPAAFVRVEEVG